MSPTQCKVFTDLNYGQLPPAGGRDKKPSQKIRLSADITNSLKEAEKPEEVTNEEAKAICPVRDLRPCRGTPGIIGLAPQGANIGSNLVAAHELGPKCAAASVALAPREVISQESSEAPEGAGSAGAGNSCPQAPRLSSEATMSGGPQCGAPGERASGPRDRVRAPARSSLTLPRRAFILAPSS